MENFNLSPAFTFKALPAFFMLMFMYSEDWFNYSHQVFFIMVNVSFLSFLLRCTLINVNFSPLSISPLSLWIEKLFLNTAWKFMQNAFKGCSAYDVQEFRVWSNLNFRLGVRPIEGSGFEFFFLITKLKF